MSPTIAEIHLDALAHNARVLQARCPSAALMAVVKADGFGHGMERVARASGAAWLGVATVDEAQRLRAAGLTQPMLAWLYGPDADFAGLSALGVDVSAATVTQLDAIASTGSAGTVHLKVDTGMSRGGAALADWPDLVGHAARLERAGRLHVRAVWTHLACADLPGHPSVAEQLDRYDQAFLAARRAGLDPELRHATNSAAILAVPRAHFDLLRAGVSLYGPEAVDGHVSGLRGAMTLRTVVAETGTVLPLGAAHGLPVAASQRAEALVGGRRCKIKKVELDHTVIAGSAEPGTEVVLFGPGTVGEPTVADWAAWGGTNPHEVLIGVGCRVPRRYEGTAA